MIEPPDDRPRVYYPELDGLRFVAFLLVFVFHGGIPQLAPAIDSAAGLIRGRGLPSPGPTIGRTVVANGWIGVQFFFVLSGFLITTLLLREEDRYGRISLKAFWARRILRIWPLYYLTVGLTFFVLPAIEGTFGSLDRRQVLPFLLFAGNWSMGLLGPPPRDEITVLWSVCVEEQFYLFCPLLVTWVAPRFRMGVVGVLMGLGILGRWFEARALVAGKITPLLFQFSTITHLDTLLAGVMLALVWPRRPRNGRRSAIVLQVLAISAFLAILATPGLARGSLFHLSADYCGIALASAAIVASAATGRGPMAGVLRYSRLVWLGTISYGLYMLHEVALRLQKRSFEAIGWFPNQEHLGPIAAFVLTVLLASASYYVVERPFLRLKKAFTRVPSRPV